MTPEADLSNWRTSPASRWAFHHVAELMPTAPIAADPGDLAELPEAQADLSGFRIDGPGGKSLDLDGFVEATAGDGLVILFDGRVVYERYDIGNAPHVPHILMSASKSVTGLVAGVLQGQGVLDVDRLVTDYLPQLASGAYAGATVRQLLDMRTGVILDLAGQQAYAAATGWDPAPADASSLHGFYEGLGPAPQPHGGPFAYVSANTDLLGWVIETATGRRFADLASDLLWKPMGAEDDAYITLDRAGAPRCTGGVCATVRDFARIGQLLVDGGARDGIEVVPEAWLADVETGGDAQAWATGEFAQGFAGLHMRYRSGWYVIDDDPKRAPKSLFAMGIHGQNLFVDRANRIVMAKVSSQAHPVDFRAIPLTHRAWDEVRRCLLDA